MFQQRNVAEEEGSQRLSKVDKEGQRRTKKDKEAKGDLDARCHIGADGIHRGLQRIARPSVEVGIARRQDRDAIIDVLHELHQHVKFVGGRGGRGPVGSDEHGLVGDCGALGGSGLVGSGLGDERSLVGGGLGGGLGGGGLGGGLVGGGLGGGLVGGGLGGGLVGGGLVGGIGEHGHVLEELLAGRVGREKTGGLGGRRGECGGLGGRHSGLGGRRSGTRGGQGEQGGKRGAHIVQLGHREVLAILHSGLVVERIQHVLVDRGDGGQGGRRILVVERLRACDRVLVIVGSLPLRVGGSVQDRLNLLLDHRLHVRGAVDVLVGNRNVLEDTDFPEVQCGGRRVDNLLKLVKFSRLVVEVETLVIDVNHHNNLLRPRELANGSLHILERVDETGAAALAGGSHRVLIFLVVFLFSCSVVGVLAGVDVQLRGCGELGVDGGGV